jgi:Transcription initiation factor IIA, large chain
MNFEYLMFVLILIAAAVAVIGLRVVAEALREILICLNGIRQFQRRPPRPPKPLLLKERVYSRMGKIYFPFLLPEVPDIGKPVKRIVSVAFNGEIVKRFDDATLKACQLNLWADENTNVSVTTYTMDAAGNISDASTVTETALDVFPPPAPPKPELIIDLLAEVAESDVGEITIYEVDPTPPVEPAPDSEPVPVGGLTEA